MACQARHGFAVGATRWARQAPRRRPVRARPARMRRGSKMSTVRLEAVKDMMDGTRQDIPMQPASVDIWDKKYRLKTKQGEALDADIDGTYQRVARALSEAEETPEKRRYWNERFLWALRHGAIPAGRITS